ncbi:hypothetical protein D3C73_1095050 [compost metagenome]
MNASSSADTPIPTKMMRMGETPFFQAAIYIKTATSDAPVKANRGIRNMLVFRLKIARNNTAAIAAPLVMPIISGEASGLRTTACIIVPANARAIPARQAITRRGRRKFQITVVSIPSPPGPASKIWMVRNGEI